jgi:hypothetical protein
MYLCYFKAVLSLKFVQTEVENKWICHTSLDNVNVYQWQKQAKTWDTNISEKKGGIITLKYMIWTDKAILWLKFSYL